MNSKEITGFGLASAKGGLLSQYLATAQLVQPITVNIWTFLADAKLTKVSLSMC